jgi:hypothetical protein
LSEFGGIAYRKKPEAGVNEIWGYSEADSDAAFLEAYRKLLEVVNEINLSSGFCYTQFADTFQEANGLLIADGERRAPLEEIYKSMLNIKPNAKKQYGA